MLSMQMTILPLASKKLLRRCSKKRTQQRAQFRLLTTGMSDWLVRASAEAGNPPFKTTSAKFGVPQSTWSPFHARLIANRSLVVRCSQPENEPIVDFVYQLNDPLDRTNSLLLIPLKATAGLVGLLVLAEQSAGPESNFTRNTIKTAEAVGAQLTVLVERLRQNERYRRLMNELDDVSRRIRSEPQFIAIKRQVLQFALSLTGFSCAALVLTSATDRTMEVVAAENLPALSPGKFTWKETTLAAFAESGDTSVWFAADPKALPFGLPLPDGTQTVIMLAINLAFRRKFILLLGDQEGRSRVS